MHPAPPERVWAAGVVEPGGRRVDDELRRVFVISVATAAAPRPSVSRACQCHAAGVRPSTGRETCNRGRYPMTEISDDELYRRGAATLLTSWEAYARGAPGAAIWRAPGVACAVFPHEPERDIYNNALLERDLPTAARAAALEAMEAAYAAAGVTRFAAWAHEDDAAMRDDLERRGYGVNESTRAMGLALADVRLPWPDIELGSLDWSGYLRLFGLPPDLLRRSDLTGFRLVVARLGGEDAAAALAFDHDGDCGIYNVGTVERARRRGLATALTALLLHHARDRGCQTASLQATPMAERVYAAVGFRDLGRILEYGPEGTR
jgi:ribosomal protein S18 acetylase RimI-like enzyme